LRRKRRGRCDEDRSGRIPRSPLPDKEGSGHVGNTDINFDAMVFETLGLLDS